MSCSPSCQCLNKRKPGANGTRSCRLPLGGFLGRKSNGELGAKTIWIGMQRTMDAALTIQALREES
ncbi:IS4 family transposase [Cupriavidus necator]|uniref:IS4 family transposase n=1 Tax=Cupriavidus necator TaxID=106590 RepID=UPI003F73E2FA